MLLPGGVLDYREIQRKYYDFAYPQARVELGGKVFANKDQDMIIGDINVELTCGFEASIARFRIFNVYDGASGQFKFNEVKQQVVLGNSLSISLGYLDSLELVFTGFVAAVTFGFDPVDLPYIEVTGLDAKGIMMSNSYALQLSAKSYGDAVREVLQRTAYQQLNNSGAITSIRVSNTPDKSAQTGGASAYTVEMVSESDYEFIVKAAKKFNFEFYVDRGVVYFREAKSDKSILMELGSASGFSRFDITYSITGMVGEIEARAMDPGAGKLIKSKSRYGGNLSTAGKARSLVSKSRKVYIDPSISSQEQADNRVASLMETMSYRLGSLETEGPGIPELVPGRFIEVKGLGKPADNRFYLTTVVHDYQSDAGYRTRLSGRASTVPQGGTP